MANDITREAPLLNTIGGLVDESELNLRHLFELLRAGRTTIIIGTIIGLLAGISYCFLAKRIYQADGLVQVEENSGKGISASQLTDISSLLQGSPLETQAEIQVLRSRMVLGEVIEKLNLLVGATPKYFPLIGAAIARSNTSAVQPVAVPGFLRGYAWGGEKITVSTWDVPDGFLDKPVLLSKTNDGFSIKLDEGSAVLNGKVGETDSIETPAGRFTIFVQELVAATGTRFQLTKYSEQRVLGQLESAYIVTEQGKHSGVISLTFQGGSADFVTDFINNVEGAYLRKDVERRSATAQQSLEFLDQQLPKLKDQVQAAQAQFKAYQSSHQSVDVSEETSLVLKQTVDLETQRLKLEQQREEALQRFTAQHPVVKALDQQLASLEGAQGKVKLETGKLPSTQQEILTLKRDLDVSTELYTQMLNSIQQLQIAKAGTIGNVRIVDPALKPIKPIKPQIRTVLMLSVVAGLLLGIVAVFGQRALLRGVDDPAEVESRFGLVTYAMIPFSAKQKRMHRALAQDVGQSHILAEVDPGDTAIEALRSLRTSLHFALLEASNNVVMLTGPAPGLGKSFVTLNLGAVLALGNKKVVVVDADLRRGHLNRYLSRPATPGLSDYIVSNADLTSITYAATIPGLDIIFRGTIPPNPAELLLHERFAELIKKLSLIYDYVLLDTPPVLAVSDPSIVGRLAGCTLVLLKSAEHPLREIEETLKRLSTGGVKVKGILFNQVGIKPGSYGYGNYGYSYYQYQSSENRGV